MYAYQLIAYSADFFFVFFILFFYKSKHTGYTGGRKLDVCTNFIPDHVHSNLGDFIHYSIVFFCWAFRCSRTLVQIQLENEGGKIE